MPASESVGDPADRHSNIYLRVSPEFKTWVDRIAETSRVTRSTCLEHGLVLLAQHLGFDEAPPKR